MKKLFALTLLALISLGSFAQEEKWEGPYVINKWHDNMFVSLGVGAQFYHLFNSGDTGTKPSFEFSAGKWITPAIGVRAQLQGFEFQNKNGLVASYNSRGSYMGQVRGTDDRRLLMVHIDALWNVSNTFWGYKKDRFYNLVPFLGMGWACTEGAIETNEDELTAHFGIRNDFRLNEAWSIYLEAESMLVRGRFDKVGDNKFETFPSLTAGITYKFKKRDFDPVQDCPVPDYSSYNNRINQLQQELAAAQNNLKEAQAKIGTATKETIVIEPVTSALAVFFVIDETTITEKEMINIGYLADVIKQFPNKKFQIVGYGDKETASQAYNKKLGERRAQTVKDALVKFGVNANQLETISIGSDDERFGKPELNRVSVIEAVPSK